MPGPDPDRVRTRSRPVKSGSGWARASFPWQAQSWSLVDLGQLGPVFKVLPGQGQAHPGPGPARSRKAQPKPARACLGQHLAGPVGSGPYQIWTCPGKSQDHVTPVQVTARQYKNEIAMASPDWASLNQFRRARTRVWPGCVSEPRSGRTVRPGWS